MPGVPIFPLFFQEVQLTPSNYIHIVVTLDLKHLQNFALHCYYLPFHNLLSFLGTHVCLNFRFSDFPFLLCDFVQMTILYYLIRKLLRHM